MYRVSLTVVANTLLKIPDLCQRRVLPARTQQVAQRRQSHASVSAFVEQRKRFLVVRRGLQCTKYVSIDFLRESRWPRLVVTAGPGLFMRRKTQSQRPAGHGSGQKDRGLLTIAEEV